MTHSDWFWKALSYWLLLENLLHVGIDGRRYGKCSTPDGRQGVCVVKRYCREATSQALTSCDDGGDIYCCPIPTTHRSAPQPPERRQPPRKPIESPLIESRNASDEHYGRPRHEHTPRERFGGDRKPDHVGEEVGTGGHRDGNDERRLTSKPKDDSRTRKHSNQTDRPSHYPSKAPHWDLQQPRISKPPRILPRNQSYEDSKASNKFPHQVPACGVKPYELFIAGGEASEAHEWPWMTAIFRRHQSSRPKTFLCGGSLINTKYVLTAAHCFVNNYVILPASSFVVRLGSHYLNSGEEYTVSQLVVHHNHSGSDFFNDIALVRLAGQVHVTDKIAPICLPTTQMMHDNLVDRVATVAGWGDTVFRTGGSRSLQHVSVPIVSSEECFAAYSRVRGAAFLARGSDHVVCAGLREGGKDACLGDSGGPLMLKISDDRWVIVGIVSLGYKCAEPGYPGVYTRVTHYMSWIQANMKRY